MINHALTLLTTLFTGCNTTLFNDVDNLGQSEPFFTCNQSGVYIVTICIAFQTYVGDITNTGSYSMIDMNTQKE